MPRTISKSQLKANMLKIFRELELSGEEMIVTDHNTAVLRIVPFKKEKGVQELFGDLQGQIVYHEEMDTPTLAEWEDVT